MKIFLVNKKNYHKKRKLKKSKKNNKKKLFKIRRVVSQVNL